MNLEIETWCGPEAQVAALSDDIAYFSHDFEDGVRANFFTLEEIIDTFSILKDVRKNKLIIHAKVFLWRHDNKNVEDQFYLVAFLICSPVSCTRHPPFFDTNSKFKPTTAIELCD